VDSKDDKQGHTDSYSFTIAQRLPWSSLFEIAYVGNQSSELQNTQGGQGSNINAVPVGALLNRGVDPNSLQPNDFRPLLGFSDINLATNNIYANYNSLQATWIRTKGRYVLNFNYAYGKAMGIINPTRDSFNLNNNYGVQAGNRTHIFNAAYSIELGSPAKNKFAGGFVNGWQLSGITQIQSGANLTANSNNGNFNFNLTPATGKTDATIPGTTYKLNNLSILGTPNIQLNPILTCDPTKNLGNNQFINPNCFAVPTTVGQNGPTVLPAIYGPAFFNSDLGLFKNFEISESKKLQIRFNAYNFLNHPLWSFNGNHLNLGFKQQADGSYQLDTTDFGAVTDKQGHRVIQLAVKFYF
jgi:hypothetical protein